MSAPRQSSQQDKTKAVELCPSSKDNGHTDHAAPPTPTPSPPLTQRPGPVPTVSKANGVRIRAYQADDDPKLMELERKCPRGEPRPFVHFRRRFVDRALLYDEPYVFIAEKEGLPVGVTSIAVKNTTIGGEAVRVAYSFDTRVDPNYRRQGIANALQEEKLALLRSQGVRGLYAMVVSTNLPSIKMLEKVGFNKVRLVIHLTFTPFPLIVPPPESPQEQTVPNDDPQFLATYGQSDLFVPTVAKSVADHNYRRFTLDHNGVRVGLSTFDQSLVYQQVSADEPWPTVEDISRRARTLQIFNAIWTKDSDMFKAVFDHVRDVAIVSNVSKLTWIVDRSNPVPRFVFEEASAQKDYWLLFNSLDPTWEPAWRNCPIYIDPRDL